MTVFDVESAERAIGYVFSDKALLELAFTHSTIAHERKREFPQSNERLEFLGDAVIQFIISEKLYEQYGGAEGELTELRKLFVSQFAQAAAVRKHKLWDFMLCANVNIEELKEKKYADPFESVAGAVYLDARNATGDKVAGFAAAQKFIFSMLDEVVVEVDKKAAENAKIAEGMYMLCAKDNSISIIRQGAQD